MTQLDDPIIVCVGPDMCGKTQIAHELSRRLNVPYFKASDEHQTFLGDRASFIEQLRYADPRLIDFLSQTRYGVVMDRGYPCESVYSRVLGRPTDVNALQTLDLAYANAGARILLCYRTSYEGIQDDLDPNLTSEVLQRLDEEYRGFAAWTKCRLKMLCVDDEDLDREVEEVLEWLKAKND